MDEMDNNLGSAFHSMLQKLKKSQKSTWNYEQKSKKPEKQEQPLNARVNYCIRDGKLNENNGTLLTCEGWYC